MKKVQCSYPGCSNRRSHYQDLKMTRPHRWLEVPNDHEGYAYCSLECQAYHKAELKQKKTSSS